MPILTDLPPVPDLSPWQNSAELVMVCDGSGYVLGVNPAFARKVGSPPETCRGRLAENWCPSQDQAGFHERLYLAIQTRRPTTIDQRWHSLQGWRWIEWEAVPLGANMIRLVGRDISRYRMAEGHLAKLSQAVEQAPVGILITSPTGEVHYMNPAYCEYSGYTLEDAIEGQLPILSEGHPSEVAYRQFCTTVAAGCAWQGTLRCPTKEGKMIWERVLVSPAIDDQGAVTHLLCLRENVTAQRELEEKLARTEEQLDDERQPSAGGRNFSDAQITLAGLGEITAQAAASLAQVTRIAQALGERIAMEQRPSDETRTGLPLDLNRIVEECAQSLALSLPARHTLVCQLEPGLPPVLGDAAVWLEALALAVQQFFNQESQPTKIMVQTRSQPAVGEGNEPKPRCVIIEIGTTSHSRSNREPLPATELRHREADLAYIAGAARRSHGRLLSAREFPLSENIQIELPTAAEA